MELRLVNQQAASEENLMVEGRAEGRGQRAAAAAPPGPAVNGSSQRRSGARKASVTEQLPESKGELAAMQLPSPAKAAITHSLPEKH